MKGKKHSAEQIIKKLREADAMISSGKTIGQAAGAVGKRHPSIFHRFFAEARWSLDRLGLTVFDLLAPWLDETIFLAVDDTLARKRGRKTFGVGMHHDPLLSTRKTAVMNWGHSWVVLGVLVQFPFRADRWFCLPVLFRLCLNKEAAARARRIYRTRPELAVENARSARHTRGIPAFSRRGR